MRLLPALCFVALSIVLPGTQVNAAEPIHASTKIWRLEDTVQVGGHSATVLGAPLVINEAGNKALYFNGSGDGLILPVNPLDGLATFSIEVLFRPERDGEEAQRFLHAQDAEENRALLEIRLKDGQWALDSFLRSEKTGERLALLDPKKSHPANTWTWVAMVYTPGHLAHFVNGVKELEGPINFPPMGPGQFSLGVRLNKVFWFKGSIREVRIHPVALTAEALQRMADAK